jgi:hypothetical protein
MSFDLCFWKSGAGSAEEIYADACECDDRRLEASESVSQFRSELVQRWITFQDLVGPSEYDFETGEQRNLDRYVLVTVPFSLVGELSEVVKLAHTYGLTVYDPQSGHLLPPRP